MIRDRIRSWLGIDDVCTSVGELQTQQARLEERQSDVVESVGVYMDALDDAKPLGEYETDVHADADILILNGNISNSHVLLEPTLRPIIEAETSVDSLLRLANHGTVHGSNFNSHPTQTSLGGEGGD